MSNEADRCRRVWVCKRCGNCEDHCKHKDESNFHEDLTMPCSVVLAMPTNEAEVPPQRLWLPLEAALLLRGDEHDPHEIEYIPASALSEAWVAFQALFDMVNCALDSRDALLISKTSATMLKAGNLLAARDAARGRKSNEG